MAADLSTVLEPVAVCVEEIHGFRYWDGRSILGFVDGTENPHGPERAWFGLIGDDDLAYKGGSYLFVQKYIHDLKAFNALSLTEQENVFGRHKLSDVEMPDDIKPKNSHSAIANVGDDFKIIRDNMPFGNMSTNQMGTYFIAYASTFSTVKKMLEKCLSAIPKETTTGYWISVKQKQAHCSLFQRWICWMIFRLIKSWFQPCIFKRYCTFSS